MIHVKDQLSIQEFDVFRNTIDQPLIIKNELTNWPATSKWSLPYFKENWGDLSVRACESVNGEHRYDESKAIQMTMETLVDYLLAEDKSNYFLSQGKFVDGLENALNDMLDISFVNKDDIAMSSIWMSGKSNATHLHWDSLPVLHALVSGTKEFTLYPPQYYDDLYPVDETLRWSNWSKFNFLRPSSSHEKYKNVPRFDLELNAGELLYIPQYWWHHVLNKDSSIGTQFLLKGSPNTEEWASFYHHRQSLRIKNHAG